MKELLRQIVKDMENPYGLDANWSVDEKILDIVVFYMNAMVVRDDEVNEEHYSIYYTLKFLSEESKISIV